MADAGRRLLDYIIRTRLHHLEQWRAELDATAESTATLLDDVQKTEARQQHDAEALAGAFSAGLARAAAQPTTPLVLDDRQPEEDQIADALIRFLDKAELASVSSEATDEGHYRYHLTIDWDALRGVAHEAGVPLEQVGAS